MAESDPHRHQMIDLLDSLEERYRLNPDVYVTGNIFLYPPRESEGAERVPVAPDIFVVFGIEKKERRIYDMEKEKKPPDVVIELTSKSTAEEDLGRKRYIYAKLGVSEYYLFDPLKEASVLQLRGYRLAGDDYLPMVVSDRIHSKALELDLVVENDRLRLYDSETGKWLRNYAEQVEARKQAEAELKQLRKELARLQSQKR
jgi:Uma2 family endonuclease